MKHLGNALGAALCALALSWHVNATAQAPAPAAAAVVEAEASAPLQNIYGRQHLSLNGRWNYIVDPYETGYYNYRREPFDTTPSGKGGFYDDLGPPQKGELVEYNFDLSPTLKIPGDWNSQDEKLVFYEGTVWMRQVFNAAPKEDKRYFLYFGAVNYQAHVYLNGKKLGTHKGGFTPFQFDVSGKLNAGRNFVVVKVDNMRHQDEIPTVNTDWWNYGGITRDVLLAEVPATYIADYKVQLAKGDLSRIQGFVQLAGARPRQSISVTIPEAGIRTTVQADASGRAAIDIPAGKLRYWSPEAPTLYDVEIAAGPDRVKDRVGFRTIETRGQDILLNGKSI